MTPRLATRDAVKRGQEAELRVNELFFSIQGESVKAGLPTVFIRLSGCPLRCRYCDTAYAFHKGRKMSVQSIIRAVAQYPRQAYHRDRRRTAGAKGLPAATPGSFVTKASRSRWRLAARMISPAWMSAL